MSGRPARAEELRTEKESESVLLGVTQVNGSVPEEEGSDRDDANIRARCSRVFTEFEKGT